MTAEIEVGLAYRKKNLQERGLVQRGLQERSRELFNGSRRYCPVAPHEVWTYKADICGSSTD